MQTQSSDPFDPQQPEQPAVPTDALQPEHPITSTDIPQVNHSPGPEDVSPTEHPVTSTNISQVNHSLDPEDISPTEDIPDVPTIHLATPTTPVTSGTRHNWQHLLLLALLLVLIGILSPLLVVYAVRNKTTVHQSSQTAQVFTPTVLPTIGPTPTPTSVPDMQFTSQIDQMLAQQVNNQQFSGSVLVAQDGQIILEKGYSMANWSTQTPNTPDTRFFLGSVTKEFTAMSILILQEEGKLQVKSLLCTYIPNCPAPWQAITVQEVLTHTSGIPQLDTSDLSGASPAAWIASFDNAPLEFAAGTEFDYCSICYEILAYVVQQVAQVPFDQFVQQMILTPLNMTETGFDPNAYYASSTGAIGYATWQSSAEQLGWGLGPQWDFLNGSGLLYSSVKDLYRWDQALYTNQLIPQQLLQQAFTPYATADLFPGSQYGYGWFISKAPVPGHTLIWHDGVIDGFRNFIGRYIDDDVTIIIQSNLASIDIVGLSHKIEQIIFGGTSSN